MNEKELKSISRVMDILKINTDTDNMNGIKSAQDYYVRLAEQMGFETVLCGKDKNGDKRVIEIRPKGGFDKIPKVGLVVHLDTVPIDEGWTHNPYGEIDKGRVFGRGIVDDKAPAIETLQVLYMLKKCLDNNWTLIVGSSEEKEWVDMEAFMKEKKAKHEELPDFSITIDGDGVQNGCRGYLDLKLSFPNETGTHCLTKFGTPEDAANNSVPGNASAIIDGNDINAQGKACHSSIPQNGVNAIIKLAEQVSKENPNAYNEYSNFFELMKKMDTSFDSSETLFFEKKPSEMNGQKVGYTSSCPTTCTLDDNEMSVNLNIRLMAGTTEEEVRNAINKICETYHCKAEISELELPAYIPSNNPSIVKLLESYEETLGKITQSEIAGGVGYNAALPRCAIFGPRYAVEHDEEDTCHAADETRTIKDIVTFMNMLARYLEKEIPSPELSKVKEEILKMQSSSDERKKVASKFREYSFSEKNMMSEMLSNPDFKLPNDKLQNEKKVIDVMKKFKDDGLYSTLTTEQLSFIVNEIIATYNLCNTSLTVEEYTEFSPILFVTMERYNDSDTVTRGLVRGENLNDGAFLKYLRGKEYMPDEMKKKVDKSLPRVEEEDYSME